MEQDYMDFVYTIESDCEKLSQDILSRVCKRAIRTMNRTEKGSPVRFAALYDDYPIRFSFFDVLSIEIQSNSYDEINPHLWDYIADVIESEYYKLSPIERFVLDHSECAKHLECDYDAVQKKLFRTFNEMLNEHWQTKKIQDFELSR